MIIIIIIEGKEYDTYKFEEINREKYIGFIYVVKCITNNKMYIGRHSAWNSNYMGSGTKITEDQRNIGIENFERYIIDLAETRDKLLSLEESYISRAFGIDTVKSNKWYNQTYCVGNDFSGEKNPMFGRKHSKKSLEKLSKAAKKQFEDPKAVKRLSEGTKKAMARPEVREKLLNRSKDHLMGGKNGRATPIIVSLNDNPIYFSCVKDACLYFQNKYGGKFNTFKNNIYSKLRGDSLTKENPLTKYTIEKY